MNAKAVKLHDKWLQSARDMDELADECEDGAEEKEAVECRERARTFRECAVDLVAEFARRKL